TTTFGEHAALLTDQSRDKLAERAAAFADLYRLRSRLVHGEVGIVNLPEQDWRRLGLGRLLLRDALLRALSIGPSIPGGLTLPALLAQARDDAKVHRALFKRLKNRAGS